MLVAAWIGGVPLPTSVSARCFFAVDGACWLIVLRAVAGRVVADYAAVAGGFAVSGCFPRAVSVVVRSCCCDGVDRAADAVGVALLPVGGLAAQSCLSQRPESLV